MDLAAHRKDRTVAFAAALLLVLQAFFTAWSAAAAPSGAMLDAWGSPICVTGAGDHAVPAGDAAKAPNCCAMGCGGSAAVPHAPAGDGVAAPADRFGTLVRFVASGHRPDLSRDHDPGAPRAPPLTA